MGGTIGVLADEHPQVPPWYFQLVLLVEQVKVVLKVRHVP